MKGLSKIEKRKNSRTGQQCGDCRSGGAWRVLEVGLGKVGGCRGGREY